MFPIRKRAAPEPPHSSQSAVDATAPATARDQAKALLSMLESGSSAGKGAIPPDRLRDIARDLVAKVEARGTPVQATAPKPPRAAPPPAPKSTPAIRTRAQRPPVFQKTNPFGSAAPPIAAAPQAAVPAAAPVASRVASASPSDDLPSPMWAGPVVEGGTRAAATQPIAWARDRSAVRKIVATAFRPEDAASEHPAIVALDLAGRPPREQAQRLRLIPPGRVRATHRHLMALERTGP